MDRFQRLVTRHQFPCDSCESVVLEVVADAFVLNLALDAGSFENFRITNAR